MSENDQFTINILFIIAFITVIGTSIYSDNNLQDRLDKQDILITNITIDINMGFFTLLISIVSFRVWGRISLLR